MRKGGKKREIDVQEKHWLVASLMSPTRDMDLNPGKCPDQESNRWPFGLQDDAQPAEPHHSGLK